MRRWITLALLAMLVSQLTGCALLYELQPHRLRQLNRGPAPSMDPDFTTMKSAPVAPSLVAISGEAACVIRAQR